MISVRKKWANGIGNKSRALGYTNISETMFTQQAHKNLIKILTARTETPYRLSQNGSNYETPRAEKNSNYRPGF